MTALTSAVQFCRELHLRNITYELRIARDEALMMSVEILVLVSCFRCQDPEIWRR
jgi:hypothetical protein